MADDVQLDPMNSYNSRPSGSDEHLVTTADSKHMLALAKFRREK